MTTPHPGADARVSVAAWQAQLLSRIRALAGEHARVTAAGPQGFDPLEADQTPEQAWRQHLDHLDAEREHTEQVAHSAGIGQAWIEDAAALGQHTTLTPPLDATDRGLVPRGNGAEGLFADMLSLDLWHLQRMAAIAAERIDRIDTGRWSIAEQPQQRAAFAVNMTLRHQRVSALAHALGLTEPEATALWGHHAEPHRRDHAVGVAVHTEADLAAAWQAYARPSPDLTVPPYVPSDPATGNPLPTTTALPPSPQQMVADAQHTLHRHFVDTALTTDNTALDAIYAAVDHPDTGHDPAGSDEPLPDPGTVGPEQEAGP